MNIDSHNIEIVEKNIVFIINKLIECIDEHPKHYNELNSVWEIAKKHSENLIVIKTALKENNKKINIINEDLFKDFLVDANEFCKGARTLLTKHFN